MAKTVKKPQTKELEQLRIPFQTPYNAKAFDRDHEENDLPSETIPDETMSVKQILDRYSKGLPIGGGKVPLYDEEDDLPDPRRLDLAELAEYREQFQKELDQIQKYQNKLKREKEEQELYKKWEQKFRQAEKEKGLSNPEEYAKKYQDYKDQDNPTQK